MRYLISITLVCLPCLAAHAQTDTTHQFFRTNSKISRYYADLTASEAVVYAMGYHSEPLIGSGYSIRNADTLKRQADGSYEGPHSKIIRQKNGLRLISTFGNSNRALRLDTVMYAGLANNDLNNAYFLDQYGMLHQELRKAYPLHYYDFVYAFDRWRAFSKEEKEMDQMQFKAWADARLKEIKDTAMAAEEKYNRVTGYITQNIRQIDYATLKDSLAQLQARYFDKGYYRDAVNAIAVEQPAYFLQLAEDLPQDRDAMFWCTVSNKAAITRLKNVQGHEKMKQSFRRAKRADTWAPVVVVGLVVAELGVAVLVGFLIF
ncbi:hypothetical protein F0L74_20990 [Chitinophaga agrisoli]|uniref:Uncharacterized protein n=1 Tax=Chitinophaga agrisoli TaxID=2607653 RepID=A0A5B2VKC3_9BACT|nr:hypothetical protein [Chitinophaga agrisoli]KAA2238697.1 hypothetical protein F0L74_20990 [Chitinophaga agrisoli]